MIVEYFFSQLGSMLGFVMIVKQKGEVMAKKINTRTKMQRTNGKVRAWLQINGYRDIWFFPHTKFSKDYHFHGQEFDGIASHENNIVLFQCKTNCKPTKQKVREYDALAARFGAEFLWFNVIDRKPLAINNIQRETFLITTHQVIP